MDKEVIEGWKREESPQTLEKPITNAGEGLGDGVEGVAASPPPVLFCLPEAEVQMASEQVYIFSLWDTRIPISSVTLWRYVYVYVSPSWCSTWTWFLCNEPLFYWQDGAPKGTPTIVSRPEYWQRQCPLYFPETEGQTYGSAIGRTAASVNAWTGGWSGQGNSTPGEVRESPPSIVQEDHIPGGFHCSDLIIKNSQVNEGVKAVVDSTVAQITEWVEEYYSIAAVS
ncbi:hypothetical protein P175DRAFT_0535946 [Aspergillus ochraceoroseus IBT 24754]|uniref:Uncharacterized protein n=1 Tax=Aspergillus ochraceoroseus IBT 24754 TaxID=1392256 RepID=A0A2T5LMV5_9EURO|nr:uncharacterized protein P175DRAFT_0535946 [Aspergillus ochraceoroseus IBT 24754]PTU17606.1 hypothetical protein P175DRAFT_0535946 [Aspergillus ochraceoroseus IBT 24754]